MEILSAIIAAAISGGSIAAILQGFTLAQWIELAAATAFLAPKLKPPVMQILSIAHPVLDLLAKDLKENMAHDIAGARGQSAWKDWMAANADAAIRAQGSDNG